MKVAQSVIELIGNTPLLNLSRLLPADSAQVYGKLEMFNPGGSIKDRPALAMIRDAETNGKLKPGMTIVEPTAGNTGIGLALVGNLLGYKTVFFVPGRMSKEKVNSMRLFGAKVFLMPDDMPMLECIARAGAYTEEQGNCYMPQQFANQANPKQAETILGPEIESQLGFLPDGLAIGAGTGGTFTGLAHWLKNKKPSAVCWLVEPVGSVFKGGTKQNYQVEGIGNSFIPSTLHLDLADDIISIPDKDSFKRCKQLALEAGLLVGGSSGANFEASAQLAAKLGKGKTVITVIPDNMDRYNSKEWVQNLVRGGY